MRCECGEQLAKDWSYCPYCGKEAVKKRFSFNLNLFNEMKNVFESMFNKSNSNKGFTIKIKTGGPQLKVKRMSKKTPSIIKLPKNTKEPEADIKVSGNRVEVSVELPDVESLRNVNLARVGDSLEIRALAGKNKGYFKILNIPSEYKLSNKELSNGLLAVQLTK